MVKIPWHLSRLFGLMTLCPWRLAPRHIHPQLSSPNRVLSHFVLYTTTLFLLHCCGSGWICYLPAKLMGTLIPNRATEPPPAAAILLAVFRLRGVPHTLIRTPVPLDFHLPSLLSWKSRPWIGKQTVKFSASSGPSTTDENVILGRRRSTEVDGGVEFVTKTNTSYYIQASPDLNTWTNFDGPILGDGNIWKKTYTTRESGQLYYRIEQAP